MRRWLPAPWLSAGLFAGWLMLNQSLAAADCLLAAFVAWLIPVLTMPLRPAPGSLRRWGVLLRLILRVGSDVVRSALEVALGVLRSRRHPPRGGFIRVPLDLRDTHALAALSIITAVVPGTVWAELAPDHSELLVHVFDFDDEASFIEHFKQAYEHPLQEIFE